MMISVRVCRCFVGLFNRSNFPLPVHRFGSVFKMSSEQTDVDFRAGVRKLIKKCNSFFNEGSSRKSCVGFYVDGVQLGFVRPQVLDQFKKYPEAFEVVEKCSNSGEGGRAAGLHLAPGLKSAEERTEAVNMALEKMREKCQSELPTLRSWFDEKYNVATSFSSSLLMQVERAAAPLFGIVTYGTHINGYTFNDSGEMMMWVAKRNTTKSTYPGMFDNLCAGGLGDNLEVLECAWKECHEEAAIDDELLEDLKSVGTVSYILEDERGVMPECEFVFDLELPQDFKPVNTDGEVDSFELLPISKVKELIAGDNFKPNSALIILDFLIRHGFLTPDTEPDYCFMVEQIHTSVQSLFSTPDS